MQTLSQISISGTPQEIYDKFYIAVNELLYINQVHEKQYFKTEEYAGIQIKKAWIKLTQDYLKTLHEKLIPLFEKNSVKQLSVIFQSVRTGKKLLAQPFTITTEETDIAYVLQHLYLNSRYKEDFVDKLVFDVEVTLTDDVVVDADWCHVKN